MLKPNIKYKVTLSAEEREFLQKLIKKGRTAGYRICRAQILLALDEIPSNESWTDEKIGKAYGSSIRTIGNIRKEFVEEGVQAVLDRKKTERPPVKISGEVEARIIAISCSEPPEGHSRWTLKLIANKVVELEILDSISDRSIGTVLKKTKLSHGL